MLLFPDKISDDYPNNALFSFTIYPVYSFSLLPKQLNIHINRLAQYTDYSLFKSFPNINEQNSTKINLKSQY